MRRLLTLAGLALALLAAPARGDGFDNPRGPTTNEGPRTLGNGASIKRGPYRYLALSPRAWPRLTVVERIDRRDSGVDRWWWLHGDYGIPEVAGDLSPGGLAADGGTLVLSTLPRSYPPKETKLIVLDTRRPARAPSSGRRIVTPLTLPGAFTFDAISPDGSRIYLVHYSYRGNRVGSFDVRAVETATGRLLPGRIPGSESEGSDGTPITQVRSGGGRWAYTLYGAATPYLQALDTVAGRAVRVDLPQLPGGRASFRLRMRLADDGRRIEAYPAAARNDGERTGKGVSIDTKSFEVTPGAAEPAASTRGPFAVELRMDRWVRDD